MLDEAGPMDSLDKECYNKNGNNINNIRSSYGDFGARGRLLRQE